MNKIKLFLASSLELKKDREQFEIFIYRRCKALVDKGIFLHLDICEDFLDAMSVDGLQSEYNEVVRKSDIFVLLVFNKVGKFTAEEFKHAFGQFSKTKKPFIFTYFKKPATTEDEEDWKSLWAFQNVLKELKHYKTEYRTIEGLKEHFSNQLEKLIATDFNTVDSAYKKGVDQAKASPPLKSHSPQRSDYSSALSPTSKGLAEEVSGASSIGVNFVHNLIILDDKSLYFIQEPFLSEFVENYWEKIALVIPITTIESLEQESYFDVINRGYIVDWLFAIVPNPHHPLDIDWVFLRPRQAHPWWYGSHPATSNFNGGGSTACFVEMLSLIETLSKDNRVQKWCQCIPDLYNDSPPKSLKSLYSLDLFRSARRLSTPSCSPFRGLYANNTRDIHHTVCLGIYGCKDATLNMKWQVQSMLRNKSWVSTTVDLADKVTLSMRLSGKSDHHITLSPLEAFEQWMGEHKDDQREPLLIRTKDDVWFCKPQVSDQYSFDAYFLDCERQKIQRLGGNGGDPTATLTTWGISPQDERLEFLFH